MADSNLYQRLNLNPTDKAPTSEEIRKARDQAVSQQDSILNNDYPDSRKAEARSKRNDVIDAYERLQDPAKKKAEDDKLGLKAADEKASLTKDETLPDKNKSVREKEKDAAMNAAAQDVEKLAEKEKKDNTTARKAYEKANKGWLDIGNQGSEPLLFMIIEMVLVRLKPFPYTGVRPENTMVSNVKSENRDEYNKLLEKYHKAGEINLNKDYGDGVRAVGFKDPEAQKKFVDEVNKRGLGNLKNVNDFSSEEPEKAPESEPHRPPTPVR